MYDIGNQKRLIEVAHICEQYVTRIQKSIFEGELSKSQLFELRDKLKKIIKNDQDSIFIYLIPNNILKKRIVLGKELINPFVVIS